MYEKYILSFRVLTLNNTYISTKIVKKGVFQINIIIGHTTTEENWVTIIFSQKIVIIKAVLQTWNEKIMKYKNSDHNL